MTTQIMTLLVWLLSMIRISLIDFVNYAFNQNFDELNKRSTYLPGRQLTDYVIKFQVELETHPSPEQAHMLMNMVAQQQLAMVTL